MPTYPRFFISSELPTAQSWGSPTKYFSRRVFWSGPGMSRQVTARLPTKVASFQAELVFAVISVSPWLWVKGFMLMCRHHTAARIYI